MKSGDKILGPYSADELGERLRAKHIVLIDEVITPFTRWRVVRDEPVFRPVIEDIRKQQLMNREDTEIAGHTQTGSGVTGTGVTMLTNVVTDPSIVIQQDAPISFGAEVDPHAPRKEDIKDVEFTENTQAPSSRNRAGEPVPPPMPTAAEMASVRQYGVSGTRARKKSAAPRLLWLLACTAVIFAAIQLMRTRGGADDAASGGSTDYDHIVSEASRAWNQGEFATALGLYKRADQSHPSQPDVVAPLATLMVRLEAQTTQAKRLLTDVMKANAAIESKTKAALFAGLGLCALAGDDNLDAEAQFQHSIDTSGGQWPAAHFDAGVVAYKRKNYDEAASRFAAAGTEPAARLMVVRSLLGTSRSSQVVSGTSPTVSVTMKDTLSIPLKLSAGARAQAEEAVDKVIAESQDFLQEAHMLKALLALGRGETKIAATEVHHALDTDPELTRDHRHDPYLNLDLLAWREFVQDCATLNDALQSSASKAFFSICLFKAGDHEKANQVIGDALGAAPEDPYLQSVNAYILAASERYEDAAAALRLVPATSTPVLADLVHARICSQNGDGGCAATLYTTLAERPAPVIASYAALAEINQRSGDRAKATEWIQKAKALSPNYRPVLQFMASTGAK